MRRHRHLASPPARGRGASASSTGLERSSGSAAQLRRARARPRRRCRGSRSAPSRKAAHGDLVRGVEHAGRGAARLARRPGQRQAAEGAPGRAARTSSGSAAARSSRGAGDRGAVRVGQRVGDRHPHVGQAEVGEQRAVAEAHHARARSTAGWTTTSMRSYGTSNSQCASITSRPLFISVAESTVIFAPIVHVGCASACSRRDRRQLARAPSPRNGPPEAVSTSDSTRPRGACRGTARAPSARCRPAGCGARRARPRRGHQRRRRRPGSPCWPARASAPRASAASVASSPAAPTIAFSTTSAPRRATSSDRRRPRPRAPRRRTSRGRARRPPASARAIAAHAVRARRGDQRARRWSGRPGRRRDSSGWPRTISSAWTPIEPVAPSTATDFTPRSVLTSIGAPLTSLVTRPMASARSSRRCRRRAGRRSGRARRRARPAGCRCPSRPQSRLRYDSNRSPTGEAKAIASASSSACPGGRDRRSGWS